MVEVKRRRDDPSHTLDVDPSAMVVGLALMAAGITVMLWNGPLSGWSLLWRLWPLQFVVFGLARMFNPRRGARLVGGWLVFFGTWLLLLQLEVIGAGTFWPLFLLAVGLAMAWKALPARSRAK